MGPAADVYALGLILCEMATAHLPYAASDLPGLLEAIASARPAPPAVAREKLAPPAR